MADVSITKQLADAQIKELGMSWEDYSPGLFLKVPHEKCA
jgi:hypothetical protein